MAGFEKGKKYDVVDSEQGWIALGVALIKMVAHYIYLFLVWKDLFTKRLKKVTMKELKVGERVTITLEAV